MSTDLFDPRSALPPSDHFSQARAGSNLGGRDFVDEKAVRGEFNKSSFNGSAFYRVKLTDCELKHSEFTECYFEGGTLVRSSLKSSDLVLSELTQMVCEDCDFSNGEWRETTFRDVTFIRSNFDHTTINLCRFINCSFDSASIETFTNVSTSYNTFTQSKFQTSFPTAFLETNFIPHGGGKNFSPHVNKHISKLCLLSATSRPTQAQLVSLVLGAIEEVLRSSKKTSSVQIRFLKNVVESIAENGWIGAYALQVIMEAVQNQAVSLSPSEGLFLEIAGLLFSIRGALYNAVAVKDTLSANTLERVESRLNCSLILPYHKDHEIGHQLAQQLVLILQLSSDAVNYEVHDGSTVLKWMVVIPIQLGIVLGAWNFFLGKVSTTIRHVNDIESGLHEMILPKLDQTLPKTDKSKEIIKSDSDIYRAEAVIRGKIESPFLDQAKELAETKSIAFLDLYQEEAALIIEILDE